MEINGDLGFEGMERWIEHRTFLEQRGNVSLYDTIVVDTGHYTFAITPRMNNN